MQKTGNIGVTTDNIFPIIKKFLYSDHEIFLRELVANAIDATRKLKALASAGEFKGELGEQRVTIKLDKEAKTITISDRGIGMTAEEVEKYINQIAFSSAGDFLDKYKDKIDAIIGHFGLGFYSSFMVSERVDILTKSYKDGAQAVKWSCDGSPVFTLEDIDKAEYGTDVVLHIDSENEEFLDQSRIDGLLKKYCKFLPVEIAFGKEQEWKDGKYEDTDKDKIINNTKPAWVRKPVDLKDEDYKNFYKELYPTQFDEPLFHIHLNVDYPFNLTGILYFPRLRQNVEIQKNRIQLYCNQVYVTDSVEGIVPDYLTLLHGVIDSPDIPLNVSRSYLQSDGNVKKISSHITKKVADRLNEIFKNNREEFEKKWDDLKLFMEFGMVTDDKFYEKAISFTLFKNMDGKYFTKDEYETLVKPNQTDKHNKLIYLYTTKPEEQYTFVSAAKAKGYDVLLMDGQLDAHFINHIESKFQDIRFVRVDADVVEKLIEKEEKLELHLSAEQQEKLRPVFESQLPTKNNYHVQFEALSDDTPVIITQSEFMRRMKEMAKTGGGMSSFYAEMPDSYNLVVNGNHPLVQNILQQTEEACATKINELRQQLSPVEKESEELAKILSGKKDEEIAQTDKDHRDELEDKKRDLKDQIDIVLTEYGKQNELVKQIIDLALLANGQLKGEALTLFVKRSVALIKY